MKSVVNIQLLYQCQQRYQTKNWFSNERINHLIGRLERLEEPEIDTLLDLTDRFVFESIRDVNSHLLAAFNKIPLSRLSAASYIFFTTLKSPKEKAEKSSDKVLNWVSLEYKIKYNFGDKIILCKNYDELEKHYIKGGLIILWDDFIGSGNTAFDAIADIQFNLFKNKKIITESENYLAISIFAMKQGVNLLKLFSIDCSAYQIFSKAITDDPNLLDCEKDRKLLLLTSAQNKILVKGHRDYKYGYENSESLLSILDKCPNNTFPFYWYYAKKREPRIFPRDKYIEDYEI